MSDELELKKLPISLIRPNPFQPRQSFPKEELEELAQSIKETGLIDPISIRPNGETYQIIAGERRWRAHQLAGFTEIWTLIRVVDDLETMEMSLIENWQREDLSTSEKEQMIERLWGTGKKMQRYQTYKDMAKKLGIGKNPKRGAEIIGRILRSRQDKLKYEIDPETPTMILSATRGLDIEDRKQVLRKIESGDIPRATDTIHLLAKTVKEATEPVKEAILKPQSRITPEVAAKILKLPEEEQEQAIQQIETLRMEEDEALAHVTLMAHPPEPPPPSPAQIEEIQERVEAFEAKSIAWKKLPETEAVKQKFQNLLYHTRVLQSFGMPSEGIHSPLVCPECGSRELGWMCHNLSIEEAMERVKQQHKEAVENLKKAKLTDEEYQEAMKELEEIT